MICSLVIPIPESKNVKILFFSSVVILIKKFESLEILFDYPDIS